MQHDTNLYNISFSAVRLSHLYASAVIQPNDIVIDATCGNGFDTIFLAEKVGSEGKVYGFDIQDIAIESTHRALLAKGLLNQSELLCCSHSEMINNIPTELIGTVTCIMFNLGYFPGGDKTLITMPDTTLIALQQSLALISVGGIITICAYRGHEGGSEEEKVVEEFCTQLSKTSFNCLKTEHINEQPNRPVLYCIHKNLILDKVNFL